MTDAILCDSCPHGHDRKTCKECNPQWSKKQTPRLSDAAKRLGEDRMSEHANHPTPWKIEPTLDPNYVIVLDANGEDVLPPIHVDDRSLYGRIVSCVNALAGLNPGAVGELVAWAERPKIVGLCKGDHAELSSIVSRLRAGRGEDRSEHEG